MEAKLIKTEKGYHLDTGSFDGIHLACYPHDVTKQRLSLKNCQAIERGYNLEDLATDAADNYDASGNWHVAYELFKAGFQKALELMGDKKFSEEDISTAYSVGYEDGKRNENFYKTLIQSLQQTEWDIEIVIQKVKDETKIVNAVKGVKGSGSKITTYKSVPKLDADGCLILKRI